MENQYDYLIRETPQNGVIVEIGAWKGKSSSYLVTEILNSGIDRTVFIVDTFSGSSDPLELPFYDAYKNEDIKSIFLQNMNHLSNAFTLIPSSSREASLQFNDSSVDTIFIDASHSYEAVKNDIVLWYPKLKPNGIIAGHDYSSSWPGVIKAVDEIFPNKVTIDNNCWFYRT